MLAEYEQTPEFQEKWRLKSREYLAQTAWKKKKLTKRVGLWDSDGVRGGERGRDASLQQHARGAMTNAVMPAVHPHTHHHPYLSPLPSIPCPLLPPPCPLLPPPPSSPSPSPPLPPAPPLPLPRHLPHSSVCLPCPPCPPQLKDETERCEAEEEETRAKLKAARKEHAEWEEKREVRVGGWRDFVTKKGGKTKSVGELKPPKLKTNDEEKLYVQRPLGEQFRPPPPPKIGHHGKL